MIKVADCFWCGGVPKMGGAGGFWLRCGGCGRECGSRLGEVEAVMDWNLQNRGDEAGEMELRRALGGIRLNEQPEEVLLDVED